MSNTETDMPETENSTALTVHKSGRELRGSSGPLVPRTVGEAVELAQLIAKGDAVIPKDFRRQPGACAAVVFQAQAWNMNPFMLLNNCYVINERVAYEGKVFLAALNQSGLLKKRLRFDYEGEGEAMTCTVTAHLIDEDEPIKVTTPPLGRVKGNSPLWQKDPQQQFSYYAARSFARRYMPEVVLGVYTQDELIDNPPPQPDNGLDTDGKPKALKSMQEEKAGQDQPAEEDDNTIDVDVEVVEAEVEQEKETDTSDNDAVAVEDEPEQDKVPDDIQPTQGDAFGLDGDDPFESDAAPEPEVESNAPEPEGMMPDIDDLLDGHDSQPEADPIEGAKAKIKETGEAEGYDAVRAMWERGIAVGNYEAVGLEMLASVTPADLKEKLVPWLIEYMTEIDDLPNDMKVLLNKAKAAFEKIANDPAKTVADLNAEQAKHAVTALQSNPSAKKRFLDMWRRYQGRMEKR